MPSKAEALQIQAHIKSNPAWFFDHFLGAKPWSKQVEIAESVRDNRITSVASCHAIGKSYISARIAIWYMMAHPESIVVTTAPTWRQVKDILWREINTAYNKARVPLGGNPPIMTGWEIDSNWYAVGLSTTEPDKFQGYHADSGDELVITDEASGIPEPIFEGVDAVLTSGKCRLLMIGNPTSASGSFYRSHRGDSLAHTIQIGAFDTPNFTANNILDEQSLVEAIESERELNIVAPYLIDPIWVYERIKKWGISSPMYQSRVLGTFPDTAEKTLIPLSWIEAAMTPERWEQVPDTGTTFYGVDPARFGDDRTVIAPRKGNRVQELSAFHKEDTMATADRVHNLLINSPYAKANIDSIGLGAGVVDRLKQRFRELEKTTGKKQWTRVFGVNVGEKADDVYSQKVDMHFGNQRAELYWRLKVMFERGEIALPNDDELAAELSSIEYRYDKKGVFWIEEKSEIKKRLLKSPDKADALMLSYANVVVGDFQLTEAPQTDPHDRRPPVASSSEDYHVGGLRDYQF